VLEQTLILAEISCKLTLEAKEWNHFSNCQRTIGKVVFARVTNLSSELVLVFVSVVGILMASLSNSEIFAKTKDAKEGAYSEYDKPCHM
jgi:hypothetical protein